MIVTCPACSVRYLVDARALGAKGRTVRCARCAHTWQQEASAAELAAALAAAPAAAAPPPPPPAVEPPTASDGPPRRRPRAAELAGEQRGGLPAVARPRRRWLPALAWAAGIIIILVALGAGAFIERAKIVSLMPGTARLYALAGLGANQPGSGLEFRNVTTSRDTVDGQPTLVIEGEVTNVSAEARPVPKLVAILRDRTEHDLQDWSFTVSTARLMPGESVPFHTSITKPNEGAAGVVVTFAAGGS